MARMVRRQMAPPPPRPRRGKALLYFFMISVLLIAVAFPTLIVITVGLLPALASWVTDRTDQKYGFFCVGGLNFAGLFPYLMDLWSGNHNITGALNIITDVFALAVIYGAAMGGWIVYTVIPPVITSFMTVLTERRLSALRANQRRIVDEWGDEVTMGIRAPGSNPPVQSAPKPASSDGPGGGALAAMEAMDAIDSNEDAGGAPPVGTGTPG